LHKKLLSLKGLPISSINISSHHCCYSKGAADEPQARSKVYLAMGLLPPLAG
jgi:hypothetical protein